MDFLNVILTIVGVLLILSSFSIFIFLIIKNKKNKPLWFIPVLGICGGIAIANIDAIKKLTFDKGSLSLEMEQIKKSESNVYATAEEVKKMRDEISTTQQNLQSTSRAFIESIYFNICTSNIIPTPLEIRKAELNRLDQLSLFAVPNPKERKEWVEQMNKFIQQAESNITKRPNKIKK